MDRAMLNQLPVKSLRMRERTFRELAADIKARTGLTELTTAARSTWSGLKRLNGRDRQQELAMIEALNGYIKDRSEANEKMIKDLLDAADACRDARLARSKSRASTTRRRTRYSY